MRRHVMWVLPAVAAGFVAHEAAPALRVEGQLKDLQDQLERGAGEDKDAHDKMDCWCQTYLQEKEKVVEDMQQQLEEFTHDIEAGTAANARMQAELDDHRQDLADGKASLRTATSMRERGAQEFSEEEKAHVQNIGQLDDAIVAVGGSPSKELTLAQLRGADHRARVASRSRRSSGTDNPDMIRGILKQMRSDFHSQLEDMRHEESVTSTQHDDLIKAKAAEIEAAQRRVEAKAQMSAKGKVDIARKQEQKEKNTELRESNVRLVSAMQAACKGNEDGFQERHQLRQAQLEDLAAAVAVLSGTQLLGTGAGGRRARGSPEELCLLGPSLVERQWRQAVRGACEKARAGQLQDAADAVQDLVDEVKAAQANATGSAEECSRKLQAASSEARDAAKVDAVHASVISGDEQTVDEQIEGITAQSASCQKAKSAIAEASGVQRRVMMGIQTTANHLSETLRQVRGRVPAEAAGKLAAVEENSSKLKVAAVSFDAACGKQAEGISALLDGAMMVASRALIPLRLSRADLEEDAVGLHAKQHHPMPTPSTHCDPKALSGKAEQLRTQAERLGSIAEDFAYGALR